MEDLDVFISARSKMSAAKKRSVEEADASVKKVKTGEDKKEEVEEEEEGGEGEEEEDDEGEDEEGEGVSKCCSGCWKGFFIVVFCS